MVGNQFAMLTRHPRRGRLRTPCTSTSSSWPAWCPCRSRSFPFPRRPGALPTSSVPSVKFASVALWMVKPTSFRELSVQFKVILGLFAFPFHVAARPVGARRRNRKHQRVHHVHLLVGEDVAVPHVLPPEVDVVVQDLRDRVHVRVEPSRRSRRW